MVLEALLVNLAEKLLSFADGEMSALLGSTSKELDKLQARLDRLGGIIRHAEQKRHTDSNVATFVKELKDAIYDADDVIDAHMIKGGKLRSDPFDMVSYYFKFFKYRREIISDIRQVNDRIDEIAKDHHQIIATISAHTGQSTSNHHARVITSTRQTSPLQELVNSIIGSQIEEAAEKLINSIVVDDDDAAKCRVFAITGMGGIGKTTLATKVYNHDKISSHFKQQNDGQDRRITSRYHGEKMTCKFLKRRAWLHVSKDYSETELLKEIIRCLGGSDGGGSDGGEKSKAELHAKLASLLPESLFLVLDDIWSTDVWFKLLRGPMENRAKKLRVLVTTRDEKVAKGLRASCIHHVEAMNVDTCWELLRHEVFDEGERDDIDSFKETGYQILEKCHGLPLAVKAIAGVLRWRDKNATEWEKVLRRSEYWSMREIHDEVPSVLYLSYEDLSPELKQCFLYCSLISADEEMSRGDLVTYWVDEGFVKVKEEDSPRPCSMEEVAEEWYGELVSRNLLQLHSPAFDGGWCTMHDHFRSLGQFLIEGEAVCIKENQRVCTSPSLKLRRLFILPNGGETLKIPDGIAEPKRLRSLFLLKGPPIKSIGEDVIGKLCNLRILMLSDSKIEGLPRSISDLYHLRHLDVDRTNIKEIPGSIERLSNLQTLRASECQFLHELPKTITSLHKLRILYVVGSPLSHVPKGVGMLKNLCRIGGLIIGHGNDQSGEQEGMEGGCDLDELRHLSNLRNLTLHNLHRSSGADAASALVGKPFLQWLGLSEGATTFGHGQVLRAQNIYDDLTPPPSIRGLRVDGFFGTDFPRWMMAPALGDSFPNLTFLALIDAKSCKELPPGLSRLPQLKYLRIEGANALTRIIGARFFAGDSRAVAFPNLEHLMLVKMTNWEEWSSLPLDQVSGVGSGKKMRLLPNLRRLILEDCPKLKALPECLSLATNLQNLSIIRALELRRIDNLPMLSDGLSIEGCERLERLSNLPSLRHLVVQDCSTLELVDNVDALEAGTIYTRAERLPQWLPSLVLRPTARFKELYMECPLKLLKDCLRDGPNWHVIQQIQDVCIRASGGEGVYMRYTKEPRHSYQTNINSYC